MLSEDKIKLMTELSLYEKKNMMQYSELTVFLKKTML